MQSFLAMDTDYSLKDYQQTPRSYYIYKHAQRVEDSNCSHVKQSLVQGSKIVDEEQRNQLNYQMLKEKIPVGIQAIGENAIIVDNPNSLSRVSTPTLSPQYPPQNHKNPTTFVYRNRCYYLSPSDLTIQSNDSKNNLIQNQQQQQLLYLSSKTPFIHLTYFTILPSYSTLLCRQKFTIVNYQFIQRSYQPYFPSSKLKQSSPAECTRNRLPRVYLPNDLYNLAICQLPSPNNYIAYLFGGVLHQQLQYSNLLWRIDLQSHTLQLLKQQGEQIQHRQGASLIPYSNWLILYGGYNLSTCSIFSDFYCYNTTTSLWYIIQTQFENLLTPRIHPTFTLNRHSNKFYIFGGLLFDYNGNERLLDDMYELTLEEMDSQSTTVGKNKKYKGNFTCKTILHKQFDDFPQKRTGHKCVWLGDEILLMVGGQKQSQNLYSLAKSLNSNQTQLIFHQKTYHNDVWIFDTITEKWTEVLSQNTNAIILPNAYFRLQQLQRKQNGIYEFAIFGGENCGLYSNQQMNVNVNKLEVDVRVYQQWRQENKNKRRQICKLCKGHNLHQPKLITPTITSFPSSQLDTWILTGMPFPFTAFSLFVQHSIQRQSSYFAMNYRQYSQKQNQLVFQDDNYLPYTAEQINKQIHILGNKDMTDVLGVGDKKYKSYHLREYNIVQFCNHLKLAGLRLGEEVFFIAGNDNREAIVYLLRKQQFALDSKSLRLNRTKKQSQESVYKSYFYAMNYDTSQLLPGYSEYIRDEVMRTYSDTIKYFLKKSHKGVGTMMKIKKLRRVLINDESSNISEQPKTRYELTPIPQRNTVILENPSLVSISDEQLRKLAQEQSIDINLRAYLSSCFLNRSTKLILKVSRFASLKPISNKKNQNTRYKPIVIDDMDEEREKGGKTWQRVQAQSLQKKNSNRKQSSLVSNVAKYIETHQQKDLTHEHNEAKSKMKQIVIDIDDESNQKQRIKRKVEQKKQIQHINGERNEVQKDQKRLQLQEQKEQEKNKQNNKQQEILCQKPQLKLITLPKLSLPSQQTRQLINSFTQIPPQSMLPKIDYMKQHQMLTEIDLDAFNQFDCKTIQVYYWRDKQSHILSYGKKEKKKEKKNKSIDDIKKQQDQDVGNRTKGEVTKTYYYKVITNRSKGKNGCDSSDDDDDQINNKSLLFPNGLLIYYKNRLIKRYQPSFGILSPFTKSPVGNLVGVIQLSEKFPVNVFSTAFINQDIQLQQLYARIQHVAYLYSRMDQSNTTTGKRLRQKENKLQALQNSQLQQQAIGDNNKMRVEVNLSMVDNQQSEGTKKIKLR